MKRYADTFAVLAVVALGSMIMGCSTIQCRIKDRVVQGAAEVVATTLECANKAAVKRDIDALVSALGFCKPKVGAPTGPIGDMVCPLLSKAVVNLLASGVPSEWQCTAAGAKDKLGGLLDGKCREWSPVEHEQAIDFP